MLGLTISVEDLLELCGICDHNIVIYDENVMGADSDNYGDLLWADDLNVPIPEKVLKQEVLSYDLEDTVFRIWVNGDGIPHTAYP